jgi:hypothetical protein
VRISRDAELRTTLDRQLASTRQLRAADYAIDRFRTAPSMVAAGLGSMAVPAIVAHAVPPGARLVDAVSSVGQVVLVRESPTPETPTRSGR